MAFGKTFERIAPILMADLIEEFDLTPEQASGFPGNFGPESGLVSGQQEGKPIGTTAPIRGSKGGVDWPQWTGARRTAFADFVEENNLPYPSYEASWRFLKHELETTHEHVIDRVKKTKTAKAAAETVGYHFEKFRGYEQIEGNPNYANRVKHAERALALYKASMPPPEPVEEITLAALAQTVAALSKTVADLTVQVAKLTALRQ